MARVHSNSAPNRPLSYKYIMSLKGLAGISNQRALELIGLLIDQSRSPRRTKGIIKALAWCDELENRKLKPANQAELFYFRANAWEARRPRKQLGATWKWEQPEVLQEILFLRRARISRGFRKLSPVRQCQILTNSGNLLSFVGRTIDAIETWSEAIAVDPLFWMARGNRGFGLIQYAKLWYSQFHQAALLLQARQDLEQAVADAHSHPHFGEPGAAMFFSRQLELLDRHVDQADFLSQFSPDAASLGKSKLERSYRSWCLSNRLFLDPLNDASIWPVAANDGLVLPSFRTTLHEPPLLIGFFNQLKQEYVSARWTFYLGTHNHGTHFSDRDATLINTLDYPVYGLASEHVRVAYRAAYSLLDKAAFFVNSYFKLKIPLAEVSFKRVWQKSKGSASVLPRFDHSKNLPLRGLYWLSKDLRDKDLKQVMNPDAFELATIRNQLEHRYLKVHEIGLRQEGMQKKRRHDKFVDTLAYSVDRSQFQEKTLRMLKLARSALMYLALAMQQEELRRNNARRKKGITVDQTLPIFDDGRKS